MQREIKRMCHLQMVCLDSSQKQYKWAANQPENLTEKNKTLLPNIFPQGNCPFIVGQCHKTLESCRAELTSSILPCCISILMFDFSSVMFHTILFLSCGVNHGVNFAVLFFFLFSLTNSCVYCGIQQTWQEYKEVLLPYVSSTLAWWEHNVCFIICCHSELILPWGFLLFILSLI